MIDIKLYDHDMNELQLDDVVLIHYKNEKMKYLAKVFFDHDSLHFVYSAGDKGYEIKRHGIKVERIGKFSDMPHLNNHLGLASGKKQVKKLIDLINTISK